jgi:hypothetical protein
MSHIFGIEHMEDVFHWAHDVGPSIPKAVEFQMIMSRNTLKIFGSGIEAAAPIFADSKEELEEATAFLRNSPIKKKAFVRTPFVPLSMNTMYRFAMSHYPDKHHWGVDNLWTDANIDDLMPFIKEIAANMPPPPAHFLWLNWFPPNKRQDMAFSVENKFYMALYGAWKNPEDTSKYSQWSTQHCKNMQHLGSGIQLADENLHRRTDRFMSEENLKKVSQIRQERDASSLFHEWHSKP